MTEKNKTAWYQRIGPAIITVCVVIGPGSVLTSTKVGSMHGYSMIWLLIVAVIFMLAYISIGAKIGVLTNQSMGDLLTARVGRWLPIAIGLSIFIMTSIYQFGNNMGISTALESLFDELPKDQAKLGNYGIIIGINVLMIGFMFLMKNLYRVLERLMMFLVALILVAFAVNLFVIRPDVVEVAKELVPTLPEKLDNSLIGLIGTTFISAAAYYQIYLVKQKGWGKDDLASGMVDARVGSLVLASITLMIMITAATVLRGKELSSLTEVANQLEPSLGPFGKILFSLALFSAAYSSFMVNAIIGGFILSDGLGRSSDPKQLVPKLFSAAVLLIGMSLACYGVYTGVDKVGAIVAAQALSIVLAPLMAGTMLWLSNDEKLMGKHKNPALLNVIAILGFLALLLLSGYSLYDKFIKPILE